jgi:Zn finger protein HypA/HybF involved in hydrogenase expression
MPTVTCQNEISQNERVMNCNTCLSSSHKLDLGSNTNADVVEV